LEFVLLFFVLLALIFPSSVALLIMFSYVYAPCDAEGGGHFDALEEEEGGCSGFLGE
jgi:hypothetical protein